MNGPVRTVSALGDATWSVTALVQNWQNGVVPNYGFVVRGTSGTGAGVRADSAETGIAPKLVVTYTQPTAEPSDLGDAPDSSNHAGVAMTAYPAVPARYPTVFDPATGLPQGPLHATPRPFHLGPQVSREAEADVGPDEDPTNNIRPAVNVPNLDRFDDGAVPNAWPLTNCARVVLPITVFISPQAVNWFHQHNNAKGYINVWLDSNRDGDWADRFNCKDSQGVSHPSVEHIVIDAPVNVIGLGAGVFVVPVLTGYVTYPAALAHQPSWVRVTLSERVSNKPLVFGTIKYGDGRGYSTPFTTGETEDYLRGPQ